MVVLSECFTKIIDLAMTTFFVLFDEFTRSFVRAGKNGGLSCSLNAAKHFTSIWSANNYRSRCHDLGCFTVKRIVLQ